MHSMWPRLIRNLKFSDSLKAPDSSLDLPFAHQCFGRDGGDRRPRCSASRVRMVRNGKDDEPVAKLCLGMSHYPGHGLDTHGPTAFPASF